jgi:hypothetical protein
MQVLGGGSWSNGQTKVIGAIERCARSNANNRFALSCHSYFLHRRVALLFLPFVLYSFVLFLANVFLFFVLLFFVLRFRFFNFAFSIVLLVILF